MRCAGRRAFHAGHQHHDRGFLDTLRIPLLEGRNFTITDKADGPPVAIVNQTLARRLWPNQPAVGPTFQIGCDHPETLQAMGVARDLLRKH